MSKLSLSNHGFSRESSTSNKVVSLSEAEKKQIKSASLSWNPRFEKLECVLTLTDSSVVRCGWDFDAKVQRDGSRVLVSRLNRLDGYNDRYVLTDRPVAKEA